MDHNPRRGTLHWPCGLRGSSRPTYAVRWSRRSRSNSNNPLRDSVSPGLLYAEMHSLEERHPHVGVMSCLTFGAAAEWASAHSLASSKRGLTMESCRHRRSTIVVLTTAVCCAVLSKS